MISKRGKITGTDQVGHNAHCSSIDILLHRLPGMPFCVFFQLLVSHDVSLFIENNAGQTACEMADKAGFKSLADYLESKMVFSVSRVSQNVMISTP